MNISIAMVTYNGADYIEKQLDSILSQTLLPAEIVISDNGSTDGTLEILEQLVKKATIIKLIHCKKQGINNNFTHALGACCGDCIAFCDQDDIWQKEKLKWLSGAFDGSALLVYGKSILIDENDQILHTDTESYLGFGRYREGHQPFYFIFSNCISGHDLMISKQLLEQALPLSDTCMYDHWIALTASIRSKIVYVPEAITYHRIHSENSVNNAVKKRESKKRGPKLSKFARFNTQRKEVLSRLEKGLQEGDNLSAAEKQYLHYLLERNKELNAKFFDIQLFMALFRARTQLFHGNLARECRNRATGGRYFRLLDVLLRRGGT